MIFALDGTAISVALISAVSLVVTGWFGYKGIVGKISNLDTTNSSQHWDNSKALKKIQEAIDFHGLKIDSVSVLMQAMVTAERYLVFRSNSDGQLIEANAAAMAFLGLPFEALADTSSAVWETLVHPEDRRRVSEHWARSLTLQQPGPLISYRYIHPATEAVTYVDAAISPLRDSSGTVVEWISVVVPRKEGAPHVSDQELVR